MIWKDIVELTIGIGTILAAIYAAKSAREAATAVKLQREAIRAQTFIDLLNYEREIGFSQCMDCVRSLKDGDCADYKKFKKREPEKDKQIRQAVDFLNHLAHLIRHGYATPKHLLVLYTPSIEACQDKLLGEGKWLEGFRMDARSPKYYLHFERLCDNLGNLWHGKEIIWPDPQIQASEEMRS